MIRDNYGRFMKGSMPWNKGRSCVYSEEVLKRMSKAKLSKHISPNTEFKRGHAPWNKGIKGLNLNNGKGWFKKGHKWPKEIKEKMLKNLRKKVLLKPNLKMNENLAYTIGLLKGDGYVGHYSRSYRIVVDTTSKRIAVHTFNALKTNRLNPFIQRVMPSNGIGKQMQYRVIAHSKFFYELYKKLTTKRLRMLLDTKDKIIGFIRGFYEAEGSIWKSKDGTICIAIHNTDLELLKLIKFLLKKLGLRFNLNGPYKNRRLGGRTSKLIYKVTTGSKKQVFNFITLVKPSVKTL